MDVKKPRLGLALSGGGFRAALFHIGVLARMAELGLLKHVEVISTVSGGTIIGTLYYLHVKRLLEKKPDEEISDRDYLEIVRTIESSFTEKIGCNFFFSTFSSYIANFRTRKEDYSRSDHLGELLDKQLYRPLLEHDGRTDTGMVKMRELVVNPRGFPGRFNPDVDNAGRRAKVPVLMINSTMLNSGHNWRFEAIRMGDPSKKRAMELMVDKSFRLERAELYADIPVSPQVGFELGYAVAASACVPAIFAPLAVSGMYDGVRVQLVDGGVHDNQGVQGLLDRDCTHFIVSDASGQLNDECNPSTRAAKVALRAQAILEERLRQEQMYRLLEAHSARVAYMHLRKGLPVEIIPLNRTQNGVTVTLRAKGQCPSAQTLKSQEISTVEGTTWDFGVNPTVQRLLSNVRTHLDAFTEVEAYSLMLDGYKMSERELADLRRELVSRQVSVQKSEIDTKWRFRHPLIEKQLADPSPEYIRQLRVAEALTLKIFRLNPKIAYWTAGAVYLVGAGSWRLTLSNSSVWNENWTLLGTTPDMLLLGVPFGAVALWGASKLLRQWPPIRQAGVMAVRRAGIFAGKVVRAAVVMERAAASAVSIPIKLHLAVFNPMFLKYGSVHNLEKRIGKAASPAHPTRTDRGGTSHFG